MEIDYANAKMFKHLTFPRRENRATRRLCLRKLEVALSEPANALVAFASVKHSHEPNDPHDLDRFVCVHEGVYKRVPAEIRSEPDVSRTVVLGMKLQRRTETAHAANAFRFGAAVNFVVGVPTGD